MRPFALMSAARSASSSSVIIGKRSATGCTGRLLISTVVLIVAPTDSLRGSDWQASSVQCRFSYRQRRQSATAHRRALEDGVSFSGRADGPHIQDNLFPWLREELGPLPDLHKRVIVTLELARVETLVGVWRGLPGRPPSDRAALAR